MRDEADRSAIGDFCRAHDMHLVGAIPFDAGLAEVERAGGAPIDRAPSSPAVVAIERLARMLAADNVMESLQAAG